MLHGIFAALQVIPPLVPFGSSTGFVSPVNVLKRVIGDDLPPSAGFLDHLKAEVKKIKRNDRRLKGILLGDMSAICNAWGGCGGQRYVFLQFYAANLLLQSQ